MKTNSIQLPSIASTLSAAILCCFGIALSGNAQAAAGSIVYYQNTFDNGTAAPHYQVFVINADGTGNRRITHPDSDDLTPALSPDGTKIAYYSGGPSGVGIYLMNTDGSEVTRVPNTDYYFNPAWSPDGTRLAAIKDNVATFNVDGSGFQAVTSDENLRITGGPSWSPEGTKIAFEAYTFANQNQQIYVVAANGGVAVRLSTNDNALYARPSWSLDGQKIACDTEDPTNVNVYGIYTLDVTTGAQTLVSHDDSAPNWSPDGTQLAFTSVRDGEHAVLGIINADGTGRHLLPTGQANDPKWGAAAVLPPAGPTPPAHGGLSNTVFTANGSKTAAANVADTVLRFRAQQTGTPAGLIVQVQYNTTADNNANDWINLNNGSKGYMTLDQVAQKFVLNSTNYPLTNHIFFRALSKASGYPDSKSNVIGPFDLTSGQRHLDTTVLYLATNGPGAEMKFRATVGIDQPGLAARIQVTTSPNDDASWTDLDDGRNGSMHPYVDSHHYYLDSTSYPPGDAVYFRAVTQSRDLGFVDSISNVVGVRNVVVGTPPPVLITVVSAPGSGSGDGTTADNPLVYPSGDFRFHAEVTVTSPPFSRQIKKIQLLYDGSVIDTRENGASSITADYSTNVPLDHVLTAIATDELGIRGLAAPVYIRITPASGKLFTMIASGDWSNPQNWRDSNGNIGVPGITDSAIVGHFTAEIVQQVSALAVSLNGGGINGKGGAFTLQKFLSVAAGQMANINLNINAGATVVLTGEANVPISGTVTNNGKIKIAGRGGIVPVPNANASAVGTDGFFEAIGAFFKNAGEFLFHRPSTRRPVTPIPPTPPAIPPLRGAAVATFENSGLIGNDGGTLIGNDGGTLIGNDGGTLIGNDGGTLIGNDGGSVISRDGAGLIGNDGGTLTSPGPAGAPSRPAGGSEETAADEGFIQTGGETNLSRLQIVGPVTLNGGTLSGSGVIVGGLTNNSGFISPGHSAGMISITGDFTQASGGTLIVENGGIHFGESDQLQVEGSATLSGNLHVRTIGGFVPDPLDTFSPLGYGSISGSFAGTGSNAQVAFNTTGALVTVNANAPQPLLGQPLNISTRVRVLTGDNVLIGGFIVTGPNGSTKKILIRGLGPSLSSAGLTGVLADPLLELHSTGGATVINDNWSDSPRKAEIPNGFAPLAKESVIIADLAPGNYTVIERGAHAEIGIGLTEVYDLDDTAPAQLANISTRGFIDTGGNVMIGGFIIGGSEPGVILVRAVGPSLKNAGLTNVLEDPILEMHDANGNVFINDDWRETQENEIMATTIPPSDNREPAILGTLVPGNYTVIVRGKNDTVGIGLVEIYKVK